MICLVIKVQSRTTAHGEEIHLTFTNRLVFFSKKPVKLICNCLGLSSCSIGISSMSPKNCEACSLVPTKRSNTYNELRLTSASDEAYLLIFQLLEDISDNNFVL